MGSDDQKTGPLTFVDRVCDEFERLWRLGSPPRIEEFLNGVPDTDRIALTLELIAVDVYFRRTAAAESPSAADYVPRFPYLERQIVEQFACASSADISQGVTALYHQFRRDRLTSTVSLTPPSAVGRYRLESLLGQGGFGEVWRAIDTELHRPVAVKLMRADRADTPQVVEAFISEGRKLAQLRHPGVVTVYDVGEAEGRCYIVSELVEGGTLAARLKGTALPGLEAAQLVARIADALHHAHLQGVIHRDIKPQNILLTEAGEPKLADFGLAANEEDQLVEAPATMGTLAYMSPEAVRGTSHHTDARADIYGLGIVLYQALTGRLPFVAHSPEQYREQILNREPRPPRTIDDRISPELERICLKCLSKSVTDRYTTSADLARELRTAVAAPSVAPAPVARSTTKLALAVTAVLLLVAGIVLSLSLWNGLSPNERGGGGQTGKPKVDAAPQLLDPLFQDLAANEIKPFKSYRLLRKEPVTLVGPRNGPEGKFFDARAETFLVSYGGFGAFALGEIHDAENYTIRVDIRQSGKWQGQVGLFFGLSPVTTDGEARTGQLIVLTSNTNPKTNTDFPMTAVRYKIKLIADGIQQHYPTLKVAYTEDLPFARTDLSNQLEIVVQSGHLARVRWGGTTLSALTSPGLNDSFSRKDYEGGFGLFVGQSGGATIENAEIRME